MRDRVIVLKLGGSVLADEDALPLAVHELYRWWRGGQRVVAVVSALRGVTESLMQRTQGAHDAHARAALLATGEHSSAALLALALDRAGVPSCVLSPAALGLLAQGPVLDAEPLQLDTHALRAAHARDEVAIVPGWCAQDSEGRTVVLGRGGSDLTALFVAQRLGAARCRLLKDVDGLYERDPRQPGPAPRRFATASFERALATDGSIVQHKAVRFAAQHGLPFELGASLSDAPTRVGAAQSCFAPPREPRLPLRVALLGLGSVGSAFLRLSQRLPDQLQVVAIAVRNLSLPREGLPDGVWLSDDCRAVARCGADVVVELMGDVPAAAPTVRAALRAGAHVVSANKALLASRGEALQSLARQRGRRLLFSAAVGGAMPLLERVAALGGARVASVRAVLNGTTNFVLEALAAGHSLQQALTDARAAGLAEADAARDLSGHDAAHKLCLLARALGVRGITLEDIPCEALDESAAATLPHSSTHSDRSGHDACAVPSHVVRQVAELHLAASTSGNTALCSVRLARVPPDDPLAALRGADNAAVITLNDDSRQLVRGRGAGGRPTAEAVLADLLSLRSQGARRPGQQPPTLAWRAPRQATSGT